MYRSFWLTYTGGGNFNPTFYCPERCSSHLLEREDCPLYCRNLWTCLFQMNRNKVWLVYMNSQKQTKTSLIAISVCLKNIIKPFMKQPSSPQLFHMAPSTRPSLVLKEYIEPLFTSIHQTTKDKEKRKASVLVARQLARSLRHQQMGSSRNRRSKTSTLSSTIANPLPHTGGSNEDAPDDDRRGGRD
jgi:hypothetical protein